MPTSLHDRTIPPTGKSISYNEIFIFRFENGRIAETWGDALLARIDRHEPHLALAA